MDGKKISFGRFLLDPEQRELSREDARGNGMSDWDVETLSLNLGLATLKQSSMQPV
jgi:hypothetical protein